MNTWKLVGLLGPITPTLLSLIGCGSSGSSATHSPDSGEGSTTATACAAIAHAQCEKRESCSSNGFANDHIYGNEAECEQRVIAPCVSALSAMGTGQTAANVENCAASYPSYTCTDFRDNDPSGACLPPAGTLGNGAICGANAQCESTFCHVSQNETCGACADVPTVGTACTSEADCGRNLSCAIATGSTSGHCAALVSEGGACLTGANPCKAGLACVGDDETTATPGTCQSQGNSEGAACDRSRKTAANCDQEYGLTCVPAAAGSGVGTCKPITLVGPGQGCGTIGAAPVTGEALCNAGGLCVNGTCIAAAADHSSCSTDTTVGPPCLPPAKCVTTAAGATSGTCEVPDASQCR